MKESNEVCFPPIEEEAVVYRVRPSSTVARDELQQELSPIEEEYISMRDRMRYKALRKSEEGYSVSVPSLPGCHSQGDSEEEAIANIESAMHAYLEVVDGPVEDPEVEFPFWTVVMEDAIIATWMTLKSEELS